MATLPEPIVSGLVPSRSPAALVSPSSTDADVVYVSFGPGSISAGRSLLIRNLRTGWSETEPLVDGGLDPVPIPAQVGDTLRLVATDSAGNSAAYVSLVKPLKPPVVVRTVPPQRKTDVPLNAAIVVVFSEPMDSVTVDSSTILLRHAGVADSGRVTLSGDRLVATFTPDRPLAPLAVYDLIVTSGVHDQSGMAMDPSLIVQFSTADATSLITSIKVTPSQVTLAPGAFVQFSVTDSQGITIPPLRIVWTSANPSIAAVDAPGVVRYVNPGSVWILASFGMLHDSVLISAPEALPLTQITAGAGQTCGLTPRHVAYCWGYVESGVLGVGFLPPGDYFTPTPMKVLGGIEWASITAGYAQSCGVTTGGDAYCWGTGAPTGIDFSETFYTPARVPGTRTMSALQAGGSTTCGIASNGHAGCWGNYANLAIIPTAADTGGGFAWRGSEPPSFSMMAAGLGYSCGVSVDGVGHCWGLSNGGQLGTGSFAPTLGYVSGYLSVIGSDTVAGGLRFTAIAAGESHTCGITTAGLAYCWGLGDQGQVGVGPMMLSHRYPTPVPVAGGLRFTALSVGLRYSCAITAAGSAYCWGANDRGQLGTGDANPRWTPAAVSGGLRFRSISAGRDHTCGMSDTGVAYCWGDNSEGELGDGMTTEVMHPTPIKVAGQP